MFSFIGIHLEEFICEARGNLLQGASYFWGDRRCVCRLQTKKRILTILFFSSLHFCDEVPGGVEPPYTVLQTAA